MRLVVLGQADPHQGFKPGYTFALIGETDSYVENLLAFLRTAVILEKLNGQEITQESLLGVIELINARTEKTFSRGMKEVAIRYSMDVPQSKLDEHNVDLVCEDPRLSLHARGQKYLVIDRSLMDSDVQTIDKDFLIDMLHTAASTYDMEASWPSGDGMRRVWHTIVASQSFKEGRAAITSHL